MRVLFLRRSGTCLPISRDRSLRVQTKRHQAALGASPAAVNRAAQFQALHHARRGAQPARALQPPRGPHAVQVKPGKMRSREKINVERIRPAVGDQLARTRPVQQRRPTPANVERPGAGHGRQPIDHAYTKDEKSEKRGQTSVPLPQCHAAQYISRPRILPKASNPGAKESRPRLPGSVCPSEACRQRLGTAERKPRVRTACGGEEGFP
jgi:hypothetical protein